jgi:hypothetical protein
MAGQVSGNIPTITKDTLINAGQDYDKVLYYTRKFAFYKSANSKWYDRAKEAEEIFHSDREGTGTIYTQKQLDALKEQNVIPLSINLAIPIIEQLTAFVTAGKPAISVLPVGDSSKHIAYVFRELVQACCYLNNFQGIEEAADVDAFVTGKGFIIIQPNNYYNHNDFNVIQDYIDWKYVYEDPSMTRVDGKDRDMVFVVKPITSLKAQRLFGLTKEETAIAQSAIAGVDGISIENWYNGITTTSVSGQDPSDRLVFVFDIYEKVTVTLYMNDSGQISSTEQDDTVKQFPRTFIRKTLKIGNIIKFSELMPISEIPVIRRVKLHRKNSTANGVLHDLVDLIISFNKTLATTMLHAQKSTNGDILVVEGTINNLKKAQDGIGTPGNIWEYSPDYQLQDGGKPGQFGVTPLNQGIYQMAQEIKKLIDFIAGIFDMQYGDSSNAPRTADGTSQIANYGAMRPNMYARHFDESNAQVMNTLIEMFQAYSPEENVLSYIDKTETGKVIRTNIKLKLEQDAEGNPQIKQALLGGQIGSIIEDLYTGEIKAILGDIKAGRYSCRYNSTGDLPSTRAMALGFLKNMLSTIPGDNPIGMAILKMMLKIADYPEVDSLMQDADVITQLQQQLQQIGQQLQQSEKNNEVLEKKLENEIRLNKELEIENEVESDLLKNKILTKQIESDLKDSKKEKSKKDAKSSK